MTSDLHRQVGATSASLLGATSLDTSFLQVMSLVELDDDRSDDLVTSSTSLVDSPTTMLLLL